MWTEHPAEDAGRVEPGDAHPVHRAARSQQRVHLSVGEEPVVADRHRAGPVGGTRVLVADRLAAGHGVQHSPYRFSGARARLERSCHDGPARTARQPGIVVPGGGPDERERKLSTGQHHRAVGRRGRGTHRGAVVRLRRAPRPDVRARRHAARHAGQARRRPRAPMVAERRHLRRRRGDGRAPRHWPRPGSDPSRSG